jgi:hypothetical protein
MNSRRTVSDFGVRVSLRFKNSPLWQLSPRALRLWMYLAMKANHAPMSVPLADGQRVQVDRGQWLTSSRKLRKELGGGSMRDIVADLAELERSGTVSLRSIPRYHGGNTPATTVVTAPCVMATLLTIEGLPLRTDPVTTVVTTSNKDKKQPISLRDEREWAEAERILAAEGR